MKSIKLLPIDASSSFVLLRRTLNDKKYRAFCHAEGATGRFAGERTRSISITKARAQIIPSGHEKSSSASFLGLCMTKACARMHKPVHRRFVIQRVHWVGLQGGAPEVSAHGEI
jgi:hypothetical protein